MRLLTIALAASVATPAWAQTAGPAPTAELTAEIRGRDAALFAAGFDHCDVDALRALVAEDFEFYHDKHGLIATTGTQWLDGIRGMCQRQKAGTDYRARRELVAGSDTVHPLNQYGAIHSGTHRFYGVEGERKGRLLEESRFFHVWKQEADGWRLTRVFSYAHELR